MPAEGDWERIDSLELYVLEQGAPLELTDDICALLRRCARDVALSPEEAEEALRGIPTAKVLLQEIRQRIREGSNRLGEARSQADSLRDEGDLERARLFLEDVLAVEVVPLYRQHAESELRVLARLQAVAASGQVDPKVNDRAQIPVLLHRVRRGLPLVITEDMRAFLLRAAARAALGEAETLEALTHPEHVGALLQRVMDRLHEGTARITAALLRMMDLKEVGDLQGARQTLLDVLAVEVLPNCRRMAEENLAHVDALIAARGG